MYPNLRAEMARKEVTLSMIAEHLGISLGTASFKFNGKNEWLFREVVEIKKFLGVSMPLEELFMKEDA